MSAIEHIKCDATFFMATTHAAVCEIIRGCCVIEIANSHLCLTIDGASSPFWKACGYSELKFLGQRVNINVTTSYDMWTEWNRRHTHYSNIRFWTRMCVVVQCPSLRVHFRQPGQQKVMSHGLDGKNGWFVMRAYSCICVSGGPLRSASSSAINPLCMSGLCVYNHCVDFDDLWAVINVNRLHVVFRLEMGLHKRGADSSAFSGFYWRILQGCVARQGSILYARFCV